MKKQSIGSRIAAPYKTAYGDIQKTFGRIGRQIGKSSNQWEAVSKKAMKRPTKKW